MENETIAIICTSTLLLIIGAVVTFLYCCKTDCQSLPSPFSSASLPAPALVTNTTQTPLLAVSPDTIQLVKNTEQNRSGDIITRLSAVEHQIQELSVTNTVLVEEIAKIKKVQLKHFVEKIPQQNTSTAVALRE